MLEFATFSCQNCGLIALFVTNPLPIAALIVSKDEMTISMVVSEKREQQRGMTFDCICNRDGCTSTRESGN